VEGKFSPSNPRVKKEEKKCSRQGGGWGEAEKNIAGNQRNANRGSGFASFTVIPHGNSKGTFWYEKRKESTLLTSSSRGQSSYKRITGHRKTSEQKERREMLARVVSCSNSRGYAPQRPVTPRKGNEGGGGRKDARNGGGWKTRIKLHHHGIVV